SEVAERSDISQRQRYAKNIFSPQRPQRKSSIFKIEREAAKVVAGLADHLVGNPLREVVIKAERAAETLAVQVAPVGHRAQQVERAQLRERDRRDERHGQR